MMRLKIYKQGQGKYTRLYSAFAGVLVSGLGCLQLYRKLSATDINMWIQTMVPVGLFALLGFFVFWLVNKASIADFMIASEGEMKKVSWSSRSEIALSTFIVIVTVAFFAALIGFTDLGFQLFFSWILG